MKNKHLIVVSVDALVYEDLEYAKTLPMFGKLIKNGAIIEKVKTIYPSLTHPVHYTMMTGCAYHRCKQLAGYSRWAGGYRLSGA